MASGTVRHVRCREDGGCSRGRHVRAHEGEVRSVARPLEVVGVTSEVTEGEGRDVDDAHVAKSFVCEQNLKKCDDAAQEDRRGAWTHVGFVRPHFLHFATVATVRFSDGFLGLTGDVLPPYMQ